MCLAFYIGSNTELPTNSWDESNPSFFVEQAKEDYDMKINVSKDYIYYAGSHEGCGCGFKNNEEWVDFNKPEEVKKLEASKKSLNQLIDYLKRALNKTKELDLFICWEGEQEETPKEIKTINPEELLKIDWSMELRDLFKIMNERVDR